MTDNRNSNGRGNHSFCRFFRTLGSAIAVAQAVETGRRPSARDLETLGIDPSHFTRIGRA